MLEDDNIDIRDTLTGLFRKDDGKNLLPALSFVY